VDESVEKILKAYEGYNELVENIKKYQERFVLTWAKKDEFLEFILKI
jgi:hypothetical protein